MGNVTTIFCYEATCDCIKTNESGNMSSKSKGLWHVPILSKESVMKCVCHLNKGLLHFTMSSKVNVVTWDCMSTKQSVRHVTMSSKVNVVTWDCMSTKQSVRHVTMSSKVNVVTCNSILN